MEKDVYEMSRDIHGAKFYGDFIDASNKYLVNRTSMRNSDAIPWENMELSIAEELSNRLKKIEKLSEQAATKGVHLANRLMSVQTCLDCDSEDKKYDFAFNHDSSVHEAIDYYGMFH